ncbi:hypothetical protein [Methanobacterium lacus]|uniref:hypothetical protein n=1 Tax=Methanobacterium lacus (strain AL-21) TaxID=877455 RepID=UPI00064E789E|nr:hypothetical protein [Methanobacterium lacus]
MEKTLKMIFIPNGTSLISSSALNKGSVRMIQSFQEHPDRMPPGPLTKLILEAKKEYEIKTCHGEK